MTAYASRNLKLSEKSYPTYELEFVVISLFVTKKFCDYLYFTKFEVVTDSNLLKYIFMIDKFYAIGQHLLAQLSNNNRYISYCSGKKSVVQKARTKKTQRCIPVGSHGHQQLNNGGHSSTGRDYHAS